MGEPKSTQRLNIVMAGHVDHGKSTVIGRLLADTGSLPEGKLEAVEASCRRNGKPFEYAFLLDALKDEQAQGITIDAAMKSAPELKQLYKEDPQVTQLVDLARKLEGLKRHTGVHAAGTVIGAGDITEFVPLAKNNKDIVTTQYDGETLGSGSTL